MPIKVSEQYKALPVDQKRLVDATIARLKAVAVIQLAEDGEPPPWFEIAAICSAARGKDSNEVLACSIAALLRLALDRAEEELQKANERIEDLCKALEQL